MRISPATLLVILVSLLVHPVYAQDIQTNTVRFEKGASSAVLEGEILGRHIVRYLLNVRAGQTISTRLSTSNSSNYFHVTAPGSDTATFNGALSGNESTFVADRSGDHVIDVYLMRNAARRNEKANYTLTVAVDGADAAKSDNTPRSDLADGLAGGPDYWRVFGVTTGDRLNLRSGSSADTSILDTAQNGDVLRNLGCIVNGSTRWCQVENRNGVKAWVAGRYLQESPKSW